MSDLWRHCRTYIARYHSKYTFLPIGREFSNPDFEQFLFGLLSVRSQSQLHHFFLIPPSAQELLKQIFIVNTPSARWPIFLILKDLIYIKSHLKELSDNYRTNMNNRKGLIHREPWWASIKVSSLRFAACSFS